MHATCPVWFCQVPVAQGVWLEDPLTSTKCPALAFMQLVWPVWFCHEPVEHGI
jgi:hypothetical protein|tara:strand:- start:232 stop:390 length:159 start_codon:yes stop_codon:yes gene_type:complete